MKLKQNGESVTCFQIVLDSWKKEIITKWKIINKSDLGKPTPFHIGFETIIIIVK